MGCATAVVAWWCLARAARWPFKFKKSKNEHSEGGQKRLRWSGQGGFLFVRFRCERTVIGDFRFKPKKAKAKLKYIFSLLTQYKKCDYQVVSAYVNLFIN